MDYMIVIPITIVIFAILMLAMAVGVIFSGRELQGSCGGSGGDDCFCEKNGLPKACELGDAEIPSECGDHDHAHQKQASVRLAENGLVID